MADQTVHLVVRNAIMVIITMALDMGKKAGLDNDEILAMYRTGARVIEHYKDKGSMADWRASDVEALIIEEISYAKQGPKVS